MNKEQSRTILCATGNQHKIQEIKAILTNISFNSPQELHIKCNPDETGTTFRENALIKAQAYFKAVVDKLNDWTIPDIKQPPLVLSEDSGLCVEALSLRPGIHSARYGLTDSDYDLTDKLYQCKKILQEMQGKTNRNAYFVCCAVLMWRLDNYCMFQATWHGQIIENTPKGSHGFGYDPIFYLPQFKCTSAELSQTEKNTYSHRAQAMRGLLPIMLEKLI